MNAQCVKNTMMTRKQLFKPIVVNLKKRILKRQNPLPPPSNRTNKDNYYQDRQILSKLMDQVGDISNAELERILKQLKK